MSSGRNRRVVIVRHGERVDHRFQNEWVEKCFDSKGNYTRQNLNQPEHLPKRKGYPQTFLRDSPLTEIGLLQATLRGQGLGAAKILKDDFEVYISPSLRCAQTATNILNAMNMSKQLKVEPPLFEWTQIEWYLNGNMPNWMGNDELIDAGFNMDPTYESPVPKGEMKEGESMDAYYARSHKLILRLLQDTEKDLLLVAHGFSLETCSRQLLGHPIRTREEILSIARHVPYCGMVILEEDAETKQWKMLSLPSSLQLSHASAHEFNASKTFCSTTPNDLKRSPNPAKEETTHTYLI